MHGCSGGAKNKRRMLFCCSFLAMLLWVGACGSSGPGVDQDSGISESDAGSEPDTSPDTGGLEGGAPQDGGNEDGGGPCSGSATIGPAGGQLSACGAALEIPSGVLSKTTTFAVERVAATGELPYLYKPAGPAFRFTPSTGFAKHVGITLPHSSSAQRRYPARLGSDGRWQLMEGSSVSSSTLCFPAMGLGTFTVLYDTVTWPPGPDGLGKGTVDVTFDGKSYSFDLDAKGSYGFHWPTPTDQLTVQIIAWQGSDRLRLDLNVDLSTNKSSLVQASLFLAGTLWSYTIAVHTGGTVTISSSQGKHLKGTVTAPLVDSNNAAKAMTASFDVTPEPYRFPMEAAAVPGLCGP